MDTRLDGIHRAIEDINRNLTLLCKDVGEDYIADARMVIKDFQETEISAIKIILEDKLTLS